MSEFTPANPITAFEILPGGEFVVVATSGATHPTVLRLRGGPQKQPDTSASAAAAAEQTASSYSEGAGLEVDLSPDFRDDAAVAPPAATSAVAR